MACISCGNLDLRLRNVLKSIWEEGLEGRMGDDVERTGGVWSVNTELADIPPKRSRGEFPVSVARTNPYQTMSSLPDSGCDNMSTCSSEEGCGTVPVTGLIRQADYGMMTPVKDEQYFNKTMTLSVTQKLEVVWHGEFTRLFQQFAPDQWHLQPVASPPQPAELYSLFKDSAKVRFICKNCGNCWTSMKGRVAFWYFLLQTVIIRVGGVYFKLYGQKCQRCNTDQYEEALWYPEEVIKVVGNVYNRVGQMFYGWERPPLMITRRKGKPKERHNSAACAACHDGVCQKEWDFKEFEPKSQANTHQTPLASPQYPSKPVDVPKQSSESPVSPQYHMEAVSSAQYLQGCAGSPHYAVDSLGCSPYGLDPMGYSLYPSSVASPLVMVPPPVVSPNLFTLPPPPYAAPFMTPTIM